MLGHMARMQEVNGTEALRILARGSRDFFPVFIMDAGFQVFGNVTHLPENFQDFRNVVEEEGAVFLGKYIPRTGVYILENIMYGGGDYCWGKKSR